MKEPFNPSGKYDRPLTNQDPGFWTASRRKRARDRAFADFKERAYAAPDMHPVRRARLAAELTQPELGRRAHVSVGAITSIECGHEPGHPHTLARLHEALDV